MGAAGGGRGLVGILWGRPQGLCGSSTPMSADLRQRGHQPDVKAAPHYVRMSRTPSPLLVIEREPRYKGQRVGLLFTMGFRSAFRPGVSAKGRVRGSASARLGAVRDGSRHPGRPVCISAVAIDSSWFSGSLGTWLGRSSSRRRAVIRLADVGGRPGFPPSRSLRVPGQLGACGVKVGLGTLGPGAQLVARLLEHLGTGLQCGAQALPLPLGVAAQLRELAACVVVTSARRLAVSVSRAMISSRSRPVSARDSQATASRKVGACCLASSARAGQ